MFKKLFQKIYKTLIILFTLLLYYFQDEDGTSKKRDFYLLNMDTKEIYYKLLDIKKELESINNNLVISKDEKKERLINIKTKLDNISKHNNEIKPINKEDIFFKEEITKVINKNNDILNSIVINNKIDVKNNIDNKDLEDKIVSNETIKENILTNEVSKDYIDDKKIEDNKIIHKEIKEDDINLSENKDKDKYIYLSYVIMTNKILKDTKTILEEVEDDIKNNIYHENDKYKIGILKEKIKKIKENYYEFKHNRYIYELENNYNLKEIDKFEILINSNNIDLYIKKCNLLIVKINELKEHKEVINTPSEKNKELPKKEELVKKNEVKKDKKPRISLELEEAYDVIKKDVIRNQKLIKEFENKIITIPTFQRRKYRFNFIDGLLNAVFKIGYAILPFKFIRNRKLKKLVEGYMVNNSIRTVRKSISPDISCDYLTLSRLRNEFDIVSDYERILSDSLYQVTTLKEEFVKYYGYLKDDDYKKLYMKIDALENIITMDLERINESKKYINNKVKILRK